MTKSKRSSRLIVPGRCQRIHGQGHVSETELVWVSFLPGTCSTRSRVTVPSVTTSLKTNTGTTEEPTTSSFLETSRLWSSLVPFRTHSMVESPQITPITVRNISD